jgi:hypothetical protein
MWRIRHRVTSDSKDFGLDDMKDASRIATN